MTLGFDKPLYVLPFDHRHSYGAEVFGFHEPMTEEQIAIVASSKQLIYDGLQSGHRSGRAQGKVRHPGRRRVRRRRSSATPLPAGSSPPCPPRRAASTSSISNTATQFAQHIETFDPTFTKVLVRYNPEGDEKGNRGNWPGSSDSPTTCTRTTGCSCSRCWCPPSPSN